MSRCVQIAQGVNLGGGSTFYGGGYYTWNRNIVQGASCVQFGVLPYKSYGNGVRVSATFSFRPQLNGDRPANTIFALWDDGGTGVQFGDYYLPQLEFNKYIPYVPSSPSMNSLWPHSILDAPSHAASFDLSLGTVVDLHQHGRWTACIANAAWYYQAASYNFTFHLESCPYSPTHAPSGDMIHSCINCISSCC